MEFEEADEDYTSIPTKDLKEMKLKISHLWERLQATHNENVRLRTKYENAPPEEDGPSTSSQTLPRKRAKNASTTTITSNNDNNHINENNNNNYNSNSSSNNNNINSISNENNNNKSSNNNVVNINNNNNNSNNYKKIIQAIDTTGLAIRQQLVRANCQSFTVKQNRINGPVNITVQSQNETEAVKTTLANNGVSFHEFKLSSERANASLSEAWSE